MLGANAKDDGFPLSYDGIPYIWLGRCQYKCHQGADKAKQQKIKHKQMVHTKMLSEHGSAAVKTRKLTQPTKKMNCPVTFHVKKLSRFPEFKITTDTKWNRTVASRNLRSALEKIKQSTLDIRGKEKT